MMLKKKNMKYVWALFWIWAISVFVACECLPPGHIELVLDIALAGVIPIVMLVWYYKKTDEGKKESKETMEDYKRREAGRLPKKNKTPLWRLIFDVNRPL